MTRKRLRIDIETYSRIDLRDTSVYRYVEDPEFTILFAWWGYSKDDIRLAMGAEEVLAIPGLFDPKVIKVAHNAQFERICFSAISGLPVGTYCDPAEYHDTMAVAASKGWPQKLEKLAPALGAEPKDTAGTALINWFCKPDSRTGKRRLPEDHPEKWQKFLDYGEQDVRTLFDVDDALGDFETDDLRAQYVADQRLNDHGVPIDVELAEAAVEAADDNRLAHELEIMRLTGISNPGSQPQMLEWLRSDVAGLKITNLQAETIEKALAGDLDPLVRRVLELRQELALVAAKKYQAALTGVNADGRLRGQFRFFGAHTGRWSGKGVQLHNLPRAALKLSREEADGLSEEEIVAATDAKVEAAITDLKEGRGADAYTLKALVRPLLVGPFTVVDYSAIEARVLAWLAGEEWVLEAFRSGKDLYVEQAQRMSDDGGVGLDLSHLDEDELELLGINPDAKVYTRSDGKVAVLALGYNGSVNALRNMGATGTDEELLAIVKRYRKTNARIVAFWSLLAKRFRTGGPVGEHIVVEKDGDDRRIVLPSGRSIHYHGCRFDRVEGQYGLRIDISFKDPKYNMARTRTYGGKLTENVTQAVARDVLADDLVAFDSPDNQRVVGHIHDELVVLGVGRHSVSSVKSVMLRSSSRWAEGLPLAAAGFTTDRYRKD